MNDKGTLIDHDRCLARSTPDRRKSRITRHDTCLHFHRTHDHTRWSTTCVTHGRYHTERHKVTGKYDTLAPQEGATRDEGVLSRLSAEIFHGHYGAGSRK